MAFQTPQVSYLCSGNLKCRVQVWLLEQKARGLLHLGGPDAGVQGSFGDGAIWWVSSFPLWNVGPLKRDTERGQLPRMARRTRLHAWPGGLHAWPGGLHSPAQLHGFETKNIQTMRKCKDSWMRGMPGPGEGTLSDCTCAGTQRG